jgi:ligand-binding sensor domain-containing protein
VRGLYRLSEDGTSTKVELPGTGGSVVVHALLRDTNGLLWAGHTFGVSIRADSGWITLGKSEGLPSSSVGALAATDDGFVWVGTEKGAVRLPMAGPWGEEAMRVLTTQDGLLHDLISAIVEDGEGGVWFGNHAAPEGGLSRLADDHWTNWTPREGLPHPNVTSLWAASDGRVWAGTGLFSEGGAAVFAKTDDEWRFERALPTEELAGPRVRSVFEDRKGRMWLGSEYDGLTIRHNRETIRFLTPNDGLPAWETMAIAQADDGAMWLGTLGGVVRIASDAVESLFVAPTSTVGGDRHEPAGDAGPVRSTAPSP